MSNVLSPMAQPSLLLSTPNHETFCFPLEFHSTSQKKHMSIGLSLGFTAAGLRCWLWAILMFSTDYHLGFSPTQHLKWILMFLSSSLLIQEKRAFPNAERQMRNTFSRQSTVSLWPAPSSVFLYVNIFPTSPKQLCICTDKANTQR